MNINDRLYDIQLRLKQNQVNQQRKRAEVKRLCQSYESQLRHFMYSLYKESIHVYNVLNNNFTKIEIVESTILTLSNILAEPSFEEGTSLEIAEKLTKFLNELSSFANTHYLDVNEPLPIDVFVFVLTLFNFCWSAESSESFCNFINKVDPKIAPKYTQCLIVHPLVQVYFKSALNPIFYKLSRTEGINIDEANNALMKSLTDYSPLIPKFLKKIIIQSKNKSNLFYNNLLKPYLANFASFGIFEPEFMLLHQNELGQLIKKLDNFFNNDIQKSSAFVESLVKKSESVCVIPDEKSIVEIHKYYVPSTLICKSSLDILDISFSFSKDSLKPIFYTPYSAQYQYTSTAPNTKTGLDNLAGVASRILLKTDLIHLEGAPKTSFEYFVKLAELSYLNGDPQIETELDKLQLLTTSLTIESICQILESDSVMNSVDDQQLNSPIDPIKSISAYSMQFSYISKLDEIINTQISSSNHALNFRFVLSFLTNYMEKNPPPHNIIESTVFVTYYTGAFDKLMAENSKFVQCDFVTHRNFHSIIVKKCEIFEKIRNDIKVIEKKRKMSKFLADFKQELIDYHQHKFLDIYKKDPAEKLKYFYEEFTVAFSSDMPFIQLDHIHLAYQVLIGLLQMQGMDEIGADQIIPFGIVATVNVNPEDLATSYEFLSRYMEPFVSVFQILDHAQEYSLVQFLSTYQFLQQKMIDVENGKSIKSDLH